MAAVGLGSFLGLPVVGVAVLTCRWVFSTTGRDRKKAATIKANDDFGLLVPVAAPPDAAAGERLRDLLAGHGIRATVATTLPPAEPVRVSADGRLLPRRPVVPLVRVLVFPADADRARALLGG